jgi:LPXTG-motif cell wall-anchored protein
MTRERRIAIRLRHKETPMDGGIIWLATIGAITALAALILGVGIMLRRRRRSHDR